MLSILCRISTFPQNIELRLTRPTFDGVTLWTQRRHEHGRRLCQVGVHDRPIGLVDKPGRDGLRPRRVLVQRIFQRKLERLGFFERQALEQSAHLPVGEYAQRHDFQSSSWGGPRRGKTSTHETLLREIDAYTLLAAGSWARA